MPTKYGVLGRTPCRIWCSREGKSAKYGVLRRKSAKYGVLRRKLPGKIWCFREGIFFTCSKLSKA
jgi:hypothetical protein